jgi:rRNA maturation endonuclease Nob1
MTGVQPKASTSWFKEAKKHCMACGKASTKVDRAACKSCGSTVWNFQAVAASQVLCLASLKALSSLS